MIQTQTIVNITDNTGAKTAMCIKVLGGTRRRYASLGDIIVVAVKKASPSGEVKRSAVERAVIVRVRKEYRREDGSYIKFDDNAAVIINEAKEPKGTRILGPIARELRSKGFAKIVSQAPEVV